MKYRYAEGHPVRVEISPGGVTLIASELAAKRLQLLKEAAPRITRVGVVHNPEHADDELRETQSGARTLGLQVVSLDVRNAAQLDSAFQTAMASGLDAMIAVSSRTIVRNRGVIVEFAMRNRLPLAGAGASGSRPELC